MSPTAADAAMAIGRLQALVDERERLDRRVQTALTDVLDAGVSPTVVASVLGVHRATVYRMLERGA